MEITKRNFKRAYALARQLSEQGLVIVKYSPDGTTIEEQLIKPGSAICWCAKEFVDSPTNTALAREIDRKTQHFGRTSCLKNKETKALLYEPSGAYQFDSDGATQYEKQLNDFLDEIIDFKDIEKCICPKQDLVENVPFELEVLNNLILCHRFWNRVTPLKEPPEDATT